MKTKTNSFTKVITFCVLAFFLITNMILFASCDNGNSPNDNINQQQNNNSQTDYCEICDGLQTENCGIKHKCDDENCVEYSDNRIYKNGHTHDYCERTDCDGSTHMGQAHPEYESWFKETTIGGENSPYKALCIDSIKYNEANPYTTEVERFNNYQNQYKSFIEGLEFSDEFIKQFPEIKNINFAEFAEYNINDQISYKESFDQLINNINNASTNAVIEVTKNIGISNNALDKQFFTLYYKAISNEIYRMGYNGEITTKTECIGNETEMEQKYIDTKKDCSKYDGYTIIPFENKYFYLENGELNPEVVQQFENMITRAAAEDRLNIDVKDLRNIIILSLTASSIEGMHDTLSSVTHAHTDECYNNEMVDVIDGVEVDKMTPIAQAKLNKSIFSHDYGRELV